MAVMLLVAYRKKQTFICISCADMQGMWKINKNKNKDKITCYPPHPSQGQPPPRHPHHPHTWLIQIPEKYFFTSVVSLLDEMNDMDSYQ